SKPTTDAAGQPLTPGPSPQGEGGETSLDSQPSTLNQEEYLLVWTTTPWTLTSNVAAAVNPDLDYVKLQAKRDGAIYYFAKDNLDSKRMEKEFKEGFGRPEWMWPENAPKLKSLSQIFKEQGGYDILDTVKGAEMVGWRYRGPFDDLPAQNMPGGVIAGQPRTTSAAPNLTPLSLGRGEGGEASDGDSPVAFKASSESRSTRQQATNGAASQPLTPGPSPQGEGNSNFQPSTLNSQPTSIECHRVIDGGRDNKGNANVTTGEGTGIVHIAPGCGDIDHKLGVEHGLVSIAPLREDGTFVEGFGEFTGQKATNPIVPQMVIDHLKKHGFHVADEIYPHVYPFCWRTGDELVFRLVDEWFVDMSWRDEIKEVVKAIQWLPPSMQGEEREIEWLTNMRDWMISKKRYWGLALPIWVDDATGEFEVIGSLVELKERAVEGWNDFEGHTPHRPWIDAVKIRSATTGNLMSRVPDVGNPWLDAGIVPFSTLDYNHDREYWKQWYPADLVLECFPGQFRNWFYSLLSLSTMMRYGETDDPKEKRPFKTLFGHRLVMNEEGQPMHKSDGTAIWFEEAAEQLGVDTLRWLYLSQNPSSDLRFGTRHPDQHVALNTPEGPIAKTKEGFTTCLVTSKPADAARRQVLIPLWNSYAFFVNYARLDGFDPKTPPVPYDDRPEIDRWVLSNLQALIATSERAWSDLDPAEACRAAAAFIDDLSNWYIRRNRRRFWRSAKERSRESEIRSPERALRESEAPAEPRVSSTTLNPAPLSLGRGVGGEGSDGGSNAPFTASSASHSKGKRAASVAARQPLTPSPSPQGEGGETLQPSTLDPQLDPDKLAAYQTLYEVLITLTKLLAPAIPFLAERMYQNLVRSWDESALESVHLCRFPIVGSHENASAGEQGSKTSTLRPVGKELSTPWNVKEAVGASITIPFDRPLVERMRLAQRVVAMGHKLREDAGHRVRQPLAELRFAAPADQASGIEQLGDVIREELNVKTITRAEHLDELVSYTYKPNLKTLGPKHGKRLAAIRNELPTLGDEQLAPLRRGENVTVTIGGEPLELAPEDVMIGTEQAAEWVTASDGAVQLALSTTLTPELIREGLARDFVRQIQQMRKDAGLQIEDRIAITYSVVGEAAKAIEAFAEFIKSETLAERLDRVETLTDGQVIRIGDFEVRVSIKRR
nr:class I tRNA ligase family protein [Planctomycetota bacterium]